MSKTSTVLVAGTINYHIIIPLPLRPKYFPRSALSGRGLEGNCVVINTFRDCG